jgi:hypothetical protein
VTKLENTTILAATWTRDCYVNAALAVTLTLQELRHARTQRQDAMAAVDFFGSKNRRVGS